MGVSCFLDVLEPHWHTDIAKEARPVYAQNTKGSLEDGGEFRHVGGA